MAFVAGATASLPPGSPMQSLKPNQLKYNIAPTSTGVMLSIWEPAPITEHRVRPFLFMVKYRLVSEFEVPNVLSYYVDAYQLTASTLQATGLRQTLSKS